MQAASIIPDARLIATASQIADLACEIQRRYYRMSVSVDRKDDASPVTLADREVEAAMRAVIEAHYPEHGIIGEEFGNVREKAALQWVLDPIDGTRSFIGGYPLFTNLIALTSGGVPVLGVISQPILNERWLGIAGRPTLMNGAPATVRKCLTLKDATVATTSIDYFSPAQLQAFQTLKKSCSGCVLGGDAYAYAMLASGHIDLVLDAGLKTYDFCSLKPVIEGAGGIITDWHGKPLSLATDGRVLAAATPELHAQALAFLKSA